MKFPVNLNNINKFENHNSTISVNVFGYEKLDYPLRISEHNYKHESTVNLLLKMIQNNITVESRICVSLQTSKHGLARYVCFRCLNTFNSKESLAPHSEYCKSYKAIKIELPEEGSKIF